MSRWSDDNLGSTIISLQPKSLSKLIDRRSMVVLTSLFHREMHSKKGGTYSFLFMLFSSYTIPFFIFTSKSKNLFQPIISTILLCKFYFQHNINFSSSKTLICSFVVYCYFQLSVFVSSLCYLYAIFFCIVHLDRPL